MTDLKASHGFELDELKSIIKTCAENGMLDDVKEVFFKEFFPLTKPQGLLRECARLCSWVQKPMLMNLDSKLSKVWSTITGFLELDQRFQLSRMSRGLYAMFTHTLNPFYGAGPVVRLPLSAFSGKMPARSGYLFDGDRIHPWLHHELVVCQNTDDLSMDGYKSFPMPPGAATTLRLEMDTPQTASIAGGIEMLSMLLTPHVSIVKLEIAGSGMLSRVSPILRSIRHLKTIEILGPDLHIDLFYEPSLMLGLERLDLRGMNHHDVPWPSLIPLPNLKSLSLQLPYSKHNAVDFAERLQTIFPGVRQLSIELWKCLDVTPLIHFLHVLRTSSVTHLSLRDVYSLDPTMRMDVFRGIL